MCILFLALKQHTNHPLIVAANRDEFFNRPCESMHHWKDHPDILAGKDLLKGGTWLGVNRDGRFSAVTNFRTGKPPRANADSRGELVQMYLTEEMDDDEFISFLERNHRDYNPFNLVFGRSSRLYTYCSEDGSLNRLESGFHSMSNGYLDQHWPKMQAGVDRIRNLIDGSSEINLDKFNQVMRDETTAGLDELPSTGVDVETEKRLSSIFINGSDYGTRTTTYLMFSESQATAHEVNYDENARIKEEQTFTLEFS